MEAWLGTHAGAVPSAAFMESSMPMRAASGIRSTTFHQVCACHQRFLG
jgi:hypothetical protein